MGPEYIIGLIVSVLVLVYLFYALLWPENFKAGSRVEMRNFRSFAKLTRISQLCETQEKL